MKLIKLLKSMFIVIWVMAILASCTKEGAVGPRGELGEDGSTILSGNTEPDPTIGKVGDYYFRLGNNDFYGPKTASGWGTAANLKGAPGAEGSTILSGTAVPNAAQGGVGDFYFKINTGDFYGPKTNAGWGLAINLKGTAGTKGSDGATIISGAAAPTDAIGTIGDFYFQVLLGNFYGPKTANGWGTPTNLKGALGATGATGATGSAGLPGSQILNGSTVPGITLGVTGDFYFNRSNGDLYGPKTTAGWGTAVSLKGSVGPKGADGSTIISGVAVPTAAIGKLGDFYFHLLVGNFYGPKTATGWGVPTNLKGSNGAAGVAGSQILSGTTAPSSTLGRAGDFYFNRNTADLYGPKSGTGWGTPVNLKGPTGPQGPPGTANVIYSPWMLVSSSQSGIYEIPAKELNQVILDGGHVAVYAKEYKGDLLLGLNQLPYISRHTGTLIEFKLSLNTITVYSNGKVLDNWGTEFRYIIIPGGIFSPDTRSQLRDYNVVKRMYNIPD
ncbi:hypothetical protein [Pedobacter foliorum]|uniref:hypothetical protein n=1 Tax=Pedobacter foliorum TaxID=2739058 RepID=UPI001567127E|nr:hypothetical protein [Pedobacter foliorum]NRF39480.1 hypothetical protein [Pedobacter foliorum]